MSELERIVEQSWDELASGRASIDEVVARHPQHAPELEALLKTAGWVAERPMVSAPGELKTQGRRRLIAHMTAHPRARKSRPSLWSSLFRRRLAPAMAALSLFLTVGTAAAQTAGPGDLLYEWRQTSETAWFYLSPDKSSAAVAVADRRAQDLLQAPANSREFELAAEAYAQWIDWIEDQGLMTGPVHIGLQGHQELFREQGIQLPALQEALNMETPGSALPTPDLSEPVNPTLVPETLDPLDVLD